MKCVVSVGSLGSLRVQTCRNLVVFSDYGELFAQRDYRYMKRIASTLFDYFCGG